MDDRTHLFISLHGLTIMELELLVMECCRGIVGVKGAYVCAASRLIAVSAGSLRVVAGDVEQSASAFGANRNSLCGLIGSPAEKLSDKHMASNWLAGGFIVHHQLFLRLL